MSASVSSPGLAPGEAGWRAAASRPWLAAAGGVAVLVCLLPPVGTLALRYVVAESVQFTVFAMVAPALVALAAPWRLLRLSVPAAGPGGDRRGAVGTTEAATIAAGGASGGTAAGGTGLLDRVAAGRRRQRSFRRAGAFLVVFMAVSLVWRLPPVMNALARQPGLAVAELVTLLPAGLGVWLELVASPPLTPRLPRPQRAAIAALAMWFTWAVAYAIGFHNGPVFRAYGAVPGRAISLIADQELAVAIVWAVAGLCFVPVVLATLMAWLRQDDDADEELQRLVRDSDQRAVVKGWGSQPGSWNSPGKSRASPVRGWRRSG